MESLPWKNQGIAADVVPKATATSFKVPQEHKELLFTAKLAEQIERYDEMVLCMRKIVKLNPELSAEERNLLSVAYKNVIGSRRHAWRIANSIAIAEEEKRRTENLPIIQGLRKQFEDELGAVCEDLLQLLDNHLVPGAPGGETKVFYLKMKGDYHRYYAEVSSDSAATEKRKAAALDAYKKAMDSAKGSLPSFNPVRLGLALNLSVFYYENMEDHTAGLELAEASFEDANNELKYPQTSLSDAERQETMLIVNLLEENIELWKTNRQ